MNCIEDDDEQSFVAKDADSALEFLALRDTLLPDRPQWQAPEPGEPWQG